MKCKNLVINTCIVMVIVAIIILGFTIFKKYYNNHKNEEDIAEFIEENYNENYTTNNSNYSSDKNLNLQYKGYNVLGVIKIPKVNLNYPIIEALNDKDEALNISIIKFSSNEINGFGNVTLAGHNYYDNTMFAKLHELNVLDTIEIMDNNKNNVAYEVYKKYNVSPTDTTCLETKDDNIRELTLITCTKGNSERLVIKAKEIK